MYSLIYTLTNVFATYTIYKFMRIFFPEPIASKRTEALFYLGYFIAITFIYFTVSVPAAMIISNLALFFLLTLNYESTLKQKLGAVCLIYITLMTIESLFVLFSNYYSLSMVVNSHYTSEFGIVAIRIVSFAAVLVISNFKSIKYGRTIPFSYWFCIAFIPASSLLLFVIFFNMPHISRNQAVLTTVNIFAINFLVFYLYNTVSEHSNNRLHQILLERQNEYYNRQFELMKSSLTAMNTLKHDLKNHLSAIYMLIDNDTPLAKEHLTEMMRVCSFDKWHANSGNISVDSILNFKLNEAQENGITVRLDLNIPQDADIPTFDMATILGNLLDNAIRANLSVEENRYIHIAMRFDKGRLLIKTENPYTGTLLEQGGRYLTTKQNIENHGLGMESIRNTLKKYDGIFTVSHADQIFKTQVLMYVD